MSVTFSECRNSPSAQSPECDTRSISVKPGWRDIPALGLHRDVMLEQRPRLRPPIHPRAELPLVRLQPPIDLARADRAAAPRSVAGVSRNRRRAHGSHAGSSAFSRTDQGYPAAVQIATQRRHHLRRRTRPAGPDADAAAPAPAAATAGSPLSGDSPSPRTPHPAAPPLAARAARSYRSRIRARYSRVACGPTRDAPMNPSFHG